MKRQKSNGLLPRPKAGIWPPPVYEAHYQDGSTLRMSFWTQAGKPVDATRGRALCSHHRQPVDGYVIQGDKRMRDLHFEPAAQEAPKPKRRSAKQIQAALAELLSCLDGETTDRDAIRKAVIQARELAT